MKKILMIIASTLFLCIGLNACNLDPPSTTRIPDNVKAVIYVTDTGELVFRDTKGDELVACVPPSGDEKAESCCQICEGLEKGSAVRNIQTVTIIKSNSQNCITLGKTADGMLRQICW